MKENTTKYTTQDGVEKAALTQKVQAVTRVSANDLVIVVQSHIKNCSVTAAHAKTEEDILVQALQEFKERQFKEMNQHINWIQF